MNNILVLKDNEIESLLSYAKVIELVEDAFVADARGQIAALPVLMHLIPEREAEFGIKAGHLKIPGAMEVIGLKAGWFGNRNGKLGLPGHFATIMLLNPLTGQTLAIMSGNIITTMRTAAAGAIAAKFLARRTDTTRVAVLGAGVQAHAQVRALREVRKVSHLNIWARRADAAAALAEQFPGLPVTVCVSVQDAVGDSDIVIATTPSREPIVCARWLKPGTHVNAIGADARGKRELDAELLANAHFVADKRVQSESLGEWQYAGRPSDFAELGEVCAGLRPARCNDSEITVFDSTGVAFQDLVVASEALRRATQRGIGRTLDL